MKNNNSRNVLNSTSNLTHELFVLTQKRLKNEKKSLTKEEISKLKALNSIIVEGIEIIKGESKPPLFKNRIYYMKYKSFFNQKRITVMGLGLLGRGLGVIRFLAKNGANLIVTDLKTEKQLSSSLNKLKKFKIKYVLGKHRLIDFKNRDMIIKAAGVPLKSEYIVEAKKNNIPIEMDASLFFKLSNCKLIGITGTKGKSTVTHLIYHILKKSNSNVFLGGNVKGLATLPLLEKVNSNSIIVLELDSWQLQGFGDSKKSPQISVFTSFSPDHMNYYSNMNTYFKDKSNIFKYQNKNDILIVSRQANSEIKKRFNKKIESKIIISKKRKFETKLLGEHNQENINLAYEVLIKLGLSDSFIRNEIKKYKGEPGRLELVKKINTVSYINDTNGTTPNAVIAALNSFNKKIILLAGGSDKKLKYDELAKYIQKKVKLLILFKGKASDDIIELLPKNFSVFVVDSMKKAFEIVKKNIKKNDFVVLSPGSASFGVFKNEYDRGEQFIKQVKIL
ncbi:UDP-N-acetylmuramoyl-L-alanine--D-glutamate ligase [Patescibacteria group bacterium]|nr:UDP-N-acetylmuramoyl-L-alanine--D-glutamate ligase [Patescibacteria group bacterium]